MDAYDLADLLSPRIEALEAELDAALTEASELRLRLERVTEGATEWRKRAEQAEADARRLATMYRMNEDIVTHIADCSYCRAYHYDCAERGEAVTALAIYRIDTDGDTIAAKYLEEK